MTCQISFKQVPDKLTPKKVLLVSILITVAFVSAAFVAPYFIDYLYGHQQGQTIRESIPTAPSEGSKVLVLEGKISIDKYGEYWIEDTERNHIKLSNKYNLVMPLNEQIKLIGYYQKTYGFNYEFVLKKIIPRSA